MGAAAPTGTVTLVFTDVEASTALWERAPSATKKAIELHDDLLRDVMEAQQGYEMRTEGDAFKVAFASPVAAVHWCHEVQSKLIGLDWPEELLAQPEAAAIQEGDRVLHRGLRVRMGGHLGVADAKVHPTTGRMDYYGPMVNETARIAAAPSGGQVVFSEAAWGIVSREEPDLGDSVLDLGEHWLKGVSRPTHLWQALPSGLAGRRFPPLRTRSAERTNVRKSAGRFVGRAEDLAVLASAFDDGARLVTVTGPGGTGKTRLSLEYAQAHLGDWLSDGGIWMCELEHAKTRLELAVGVANALGVKLSGSDVDDAGAAARVVEGSLAGLGRSLLILDNLEQVVPADLRLIAEWLDGVPGSHFLATSRHRLQISGERVIDLQPLRSDAAVELFIERAVEVRPAFAPTKEEERHILGIVEQVDCLPLAVELAASRVDVMSVAAIAKRLSQRFRLLSKKGEGPARQSALRGAIDWSWDLLDAAEKSALAQCSVFTGGFTADAADEIVDLDDIDDAPWPIDVVQALRQKSLLRSRDTVTELRLDMYASIQEYAAEKLKEMGSREGAKQRHAEYFLAAAERWNDEAYGPNDARSLAALHANAQNLMTAIETLWPDNPAAAARVAIGLGRGIYSGAGLTGYTEVMDRVLAFAESQRDDRLLVQGLEIRGHMRQVTVDARATEDFRRGLELAQKIGDRALEARLSRHLASEVMFGRLNHDEYTPLIEKAAALFRELDMTLPLADLLLQRSFASNFLEDHELSRKLVSEAWELAQGRAGPLLTSMFENGRAAIALIDRDWKTAEASYTAVLALHRRAGDGAGGFAAAYMAVVQAQQGNGELAREFIEDAEMLLNKSPAPGLRAIPQVCLAWVHVIEAGRAKANDDAEGADRELGEARKLSRLLFEVGPRDEDHPEGRPPLIENSAAIKYAARLVRGELAFHGFAREAIEP
jgi:predicted ATPase/class 3 adenylate cyclase